MLKIRINEDGTWGISGRDEEKATKQDFIERLMWVVNQHIEDDGNCYYLTFHRECPEIDGVRYNRLHSCRIVEGDLLLLCEVWHHPEKNIEISVNDMSKDLLWSLMDGTHITHNNRIWMEVGRYNADREPCNKLHKCAGFDCVFFSSFGTCRIYK